MSAEVKKGWVSVLKTMAVVASGVVVGMYLKQMIDKVFVTKTAKLSMPISLKSPIQPVSEESGS